MNLGFAAASLTALVTWGVHTFVGGVYAARPLLAAPNLHKASLWLNYYTWHMATLLLLAMIAGFTWAAVDEAAREVALVFTVLATCFSVLCVWVALKGGIKPHRFPASYLFAIMAAAGLAGLVL